MGILRNRSSLSHYPAEWPKPRVSPLSWVPWAEASEPFCPFTGQPLRSLPFSSKTAARGARSLALALSFPPSFHPSSPPRLPLVSQGSPPSAPLWIITRFKGPQAKAGGGGKGGGSGAGAACEPGTLNSEGVRRRTRKAERAGAGRQP